MDKGRLVERGSYQQLKERGGLFSELLEQQKMERSQEEEA
jgi:ABC-type multidrug transport system fused ATPase/permease subunit